MCEFCTRHGEGKKWYENIANYTEEVFLEVNSVERLKKFLTNFGHSLKVGVTQAHRLKKRFPRIYRLLAYPVVTNRLRKSHFGQIVPLEDVEAILDRVQSIVRLPCICRKVAAGIEKRYCFGIGLDLTPVFREVPDFRQFERWPRERAKEYIRQLDTEGKTHSVWTFETPFIGALCNCDQDCMAYRAQVKMGIGRTMWKAEYVAEIDPLRCTGCKLCMERCFFNGLSYDRGKKKCVVNAANCFGCGVCRPACQHDAVRLLDRAAVPLAAANW